MKQYIYTIILCLMALLSHAQSDPAPKPPFSAASIQGFAKISAGDTIHTGYQSGFGFFNIAGRSWVTKNFPFRHDSLTAINYSTFLNQAGQLAQIPYLTFDGNEFTFSKSLYINGVQTGINFSPPSGAAGNYAIIAQDDTTLTLYRSGHSGVASDGQITAYGNNLKDGNGVRFAKMTDIPSLSGYMTVSGSNQTITQHPTLQGGATFGYMANVSVDQSPFTPNGINIVPGSDATIIQISGRDGLGLLGLYSGKNIATFNDDNPLADGANIAFYFPVTLGYDIMANTDTGATVLLQEDRTITGNPGRISGIKLSKFAAASSLSGYIPYTGATSDVNLGSHTFETNKIILNPQSNFDPNGWGGISTFAVNGNIYSNSDMHIDAYIYAKGVHCITDGFYASTTTNIGYLGNNLLLFESGDGSIQIGEYWNNKMVFADNSNLSNGFKTTIYPNGGTELTANNTIYFPPQSGTIALTSDIPSVSGYIPYTGATSDINMGAHILTSSNGTDYVAEGYNTGGGTPSIDIYHGISYASYRYSQIIYNDGTNAIYLQAPTAPFGANYTLTYPAKTGTIATLGDIPSVSGYLPYTGATTNVNTGGYNVTANIFYTTNWIQTGAINGANSSVLSQNSLTFNDLTTSVAATYTRNYWTIQDASSGNKVQVSANTAMTGAVSISLPSTSGTIALTSDIASAGYITASSTNTLTNKSISGSTNTLTNIPNSALTNSTISGVALGSNLPILTLSTGLTGNSYNGSSTITAAIDQSFSPTWTGAHKFVSGSTVFGTNSAINSVVGINGAISTAISASSAGRLFSVSTGTITRTSDAGSISGVTAASSFGTPTYATSSSTTYANAATLYIDGAPLSGSNATLTNSFALYSNSGINYFGGAMYAAGNLSVGTGSIANFFAQGGTSSSSAQAISNLLFAGALSVQAHAWFNGNFSATLGANVSGANVIFAGEPFTTSPTAGTHALIANLVVQPVGTITPGTGTVTNTAALYIAGNGSATVTGSNMGLWATGNTRIDLGSDATGDLFYRNSNNTLSRLPIGSSGQILTVSGGAPSWSKGINYLNGRTAISDVSYTQLSTDYLIAYTALTSARTVSLIAINDNQTILIKDESGNAATYNIIINAPAGKSIDGASSKTITTNMGSVKLYFQASSGNYFTY